MATSGNMARRLTIGIRLAVAVVLGGIGAAAGFTHTHNWADHHGQHGWLAWADAVVIEGITTVAGFEIHRDHQAGRRAPVSLPVVVLVVGFLVQMAAQVAEAEPTPAGWLLAAMPALGFLTVVKLLMRRLPAEPAADEKAAPAPDQQHDHPVPTVRLRLPAAMQQAIADTARAVAAEGRELTTADIRAAARVGEDMAQRILASLTDHNGQAVNN